MVRTDVDYQFTQLVVDKVEAEDGQYDVMFIGTGMHFTQVTEPSIMCFYMLYARLVHHIGIFGIH